jgi:LacI family transcriptional regulator
MPLEKRITMEDVARHCNVSKATVSRVLSGSSGETAVSDELVRRVKNAVKQLNYTPDRKRLGKRVTMEDIARHCNVSKATVSRVLSGSPGDYPVSDELVRRVKKTAERFDYRPNRMARAVSNQRTHLIGLSCFYTDAPNRAPDRVAYDRQSLGEYVDIIVSHPEFEDYDLVFHARKETADRPLTPQDFQADLLDGMIYVSPSDEHTEFIDVASKDFPIVLLGQLAVAEKKVPCVDVDNRKLAQQAIEHLIGLGRRNILMLIPEKLQHLLCIQDRQQGYRDALTRNGIEVSDKFIHTMRSLKDTVAAFFEGFSGLEKVDAVFCATDELSELCIEPLKALGYRIPEDIALIDFSEAPASRHTNPPLSSVHISAEKQVYAAIDLLLKILNKEIPYEPGFHEIESKLVIRESTAAANPPNAMSRT